MRSNSSFLLLTLAFGLIFGSYVGFANLVSNLLDPFGLEPQDIARIGMGLLFSGIIGAVATGLFVDRTGKYKSTCLAMAFLTSALVLCMTWTLKTQVMAAFIALACALGFSAVGYVPVALAFGVELTFPMAAATVNGSMLLLGQAFGFAQSLIVTFISDDRAVDDLLTVEELLTVRQRRSMIAVAYLGLVVFVALWISCAVKEDLRRLKYIAKTNDKNGTYKSPDEP